MSNYKIELERTESQNLEIKKHISDVKDIVKSKVNKDVNGLNSIKELLENETLGGHIVGDVIVAENIETEYNILNKDSYNTTKRIKRSGSSGGDIVCINKTSNDDVYIFYKKRIVVINKLNQVKFEMDLDFTMHSATISNNDCVFIADSTNIYELKDGEFIKILQFTDAKGFGIEGMIVVEDFFYINSRYHITKISINDKYWDYKPTTNNWFSTIYSDGSYIYYGERASQSSKNTGKLSLDGEVLGKYSYTYDINSVFANDGGIFSGGNNRVLTCHNKNMEKIWNRTTSSNVWSIRGDTDSNIYVGLGDSNIIKLTPSGDDVLILSTSNPVTKELVIDSDFSIYNVYGPEMTKNELDRIITGYKVLKVERGL